MPSDDEQAKLPDEEKEGLALWATIQMQCVRLVHVMHNETKYINYMALLLAIRKFGHVCPDKKALARSLRDIIATELEQMK